MWFVGYNRAIRWLCDGLSMCRWKGNGDTPNGRKSNDWWCLSDDHFEDVCAHVVKEEWVVNGVPWEHEGVAWWR